MPTRSNLRGKYQFGKDGERKLSDWMKKNLTFSFVAINRPNCEWIEDEVIRLLCPPLNLEGNLKNEFGSFIEDARKACRDEAANYAKGQCE
jgi:hypothetical protein